MEEQERISRKKDMWNVMCSMILVENFLDGSYNL